jgi:hypothetical protein
MTRALESLGNRPRDPEDAQTASPGKACRSVLHQRCHGVPAGQPERARKLCVQRRPEHAGSAQAGLSFPVIAPFVSGLLRNSDRQQVRFPGSLHARALARPRLFITMANRGEVPLCSAPEVALQPLAPRRWVKHGAYPTKSDSPLPEYGVTHRHGECTNSSRSHAPTGGRLRPTTRGGPR